MSRKVYGFGKKVWKVLEAFGEGVNQAQAKSKAKSESQTPEFLRLALSPPPPHAMRVIRYQQLESPALCDSCMHLHTIFLNTTLN